MPFTDPGPQNPVFTPSTLHLVVLDVLLAFLQLITIVLAFGATVPTDLDATTSTESSRDYSSLLGIDDDYEDEAEGRDSLGASGSRTFRGRDGYSALAHVEEGGSRPSMFDMELDDLGVGKSRLLVGQIQMSAHRSPHTHQAPRLNIRRSRHQILPCDCACPCRSSRQFDSARSGEKSASRRHRTERNARRAA